MATFYAGQEDYITQLNTLYDLIAGSGTVFPALVTGKYLTNNGTTMSWGDISGYTNTSLSNLTTTSINVSLIPDTTETLDLGSSSKRWNKLYLKGNSIDLGGAIISSSAGAVSLPAGSTIGGSNIGAVQIQSDWTQVATITVASGSFIVGTSYIIASVGSTNFTLIGSANNTVGTTFSATGVGIGSGTATTAALDYIKNKPTIS